MTNTIRSEGLYVDGVAVAVVGNHDVLITTKRDYGKTNHIISVEFAGVGYLDVHFFGGNGWEGLSDGRIRRQLKE